MNKTTLYKKIVYGGHISLSKPFSAGFMDSRTRSISQAKNRAKAVIMLSDMVTFITLTFADEDIRHSFYQCYMYTKRFLAALKKIFPDLEYSCGFHCSNHFHAHIITNIPIYRFADETDMLDYSAYKLDVSGFMNSPVYGDTEIKTINDDEQYYSRENLCKYLLKDFWYLYGVEYDKSKDYQGYTKIKPFIHSSGMKTIKDIQSSLYMIDTDTEEVQCISGYDIRYENRIKTLIYDTYPYDDVDVSRDILDFIGIDNIVKDIMDKNIVRNDDILNYLSALIQEQYYKVDDEDISEDGFYPVLKRNITFFKALKPLKKLNFFKKRDIIINNNNQELLLLYFKRFLFFFSRGKKQFGIRPPPIYTHAP